MVHYGLAAKATISRQVALDRAYESYPERFVNKAPKAPVLPEAVWINPPTTNQADVDRNTRLAGAIPQGVIAL